MSEKQNNTINSLTHTLVAMSTPYSICAEIQTLNYGKYKVEIGKICERYSQAIQVHIAPNLVDIANELEAKIL